MNSEPDTAIVNEVGAELLCRRCLYPLAGLPECCCPECGATFDLNNPRSFLTHARLRRRRWIRRTLVALAITLVVLGVAGGVAWRWADIETRTMVYACQECGAKRTCHEYWLNGYKVYEREIAVEATPLSKFMSAHVGAHTHTWRFWQGTRRDWNGQERFPRPYNTSGMSDLMRLQEHFAVELLEDLREEVPLLPRMIREHILASDSRNAGWRASTLGSALKRPKGKRGAFLLRDWNLSMIADAWEERAATRPEE
ncbi:MAG: hypothetical protein PVJ57_22945 [Phycisphaerae bacterium]|jgi:hypothetical protein